MDTEEALWKYLAANPDDISAKLALADLLDEQRQNYISKALKWCVGRGKWPEYQLTEFPTCRYERWSWYGNDGSTNSRDLPTKLYGFMPHACSSKLSDLFDSIGIAFRRMDSLMNPELED